MNAISRKLQKQLKIQDHKKEKPYELTVFNGTTLKGREVTHHTRPLEMKLQQHHERLPFDIIDLADHEVVLGLPWLRKWNPRIDWITHEVRVRRSNNRHERPGQRKETLADERKPLRMASKKLVAASQANSLSHRHGSQREEN